jgi:hypothetical protein
MKRLKTARNSNRDQIRYRLHTSIQAAAYLADNPSERDIDRELSNIMNGSRPKAPSPAEAEHPPTPHRTTITTRILVGALVGAVAVAVAGVAVTVFVVGILLGLATGTALETLFATTLLIDYLFGVTLGIVATAIFGSAREDRNMSLLYHAPDPISAGARALLSAFGRNDADLDRQGRG